ncbi:phosphoglycerate dehydrogenase [Enterococcus hulanensis]|uniref:Phosphoglycerate dehydrogenase n=1 Tax=Enterococcus hulanensis TaxID=2559929 RepID=A0ABU3F225_9ENTE|nr:MULTISPECIES: phosphoglycerate dehydrogenase [Enterococcus]MBO0458885.1 phosphoglycerate dehydrogenase [Enterococcus hulanensis]MBX8937458.1 phosphoglycerate dehydrogenase [Enterococcus gilvus]MDT2600211.1 phosphoglycerate dehydrogenase [Enterococcus hulanensis]MDT2609024.1 phosphoglycerate dehydrogenase [Enterococcus hulanensis]MDT2616934.1 phosphoglycerate dehydrogenase [Enterococcus hulanensis]
MKVLITPRGFASYGLDQVEKMRKAGLEVHYNDTGLAYTPEEFSELAKDADAIIVGVDKIDKTVIDQCPKLKAVCKFGVGTDNIDVKYAKSKNIYVGRTIGSNSNAVAEHVMSLIYCESKNLWTTIRDVKNHGWEKPTGFEVSEKVLGIIGFGAIGKYLAKQAVGVGMTVQVNDVFDIPTEVLDEYQVEKVELEDLLESSDYISLHLPLINDTKNMISTKEFKKMKNSACLLNAARGGIVDEQALYQALKNKEIRSACFDVFSTEPPAEDEPLLALDNFLLTSHTAARTIESEKRTCEYSSRIIMEQLHVI